MMTYEEFENSEDRLICMLPADDEYTPVYCAEWGIVGEYPHGRYALCDDGNEIDL
ncbi:MAG: hypothetical protein NC548_29040 [Lachnospiraceae bacterium]|nr:hypothetical protein [Lachnospiraceae bacterium]